MWTIAERSQMKRYRDEPAAELSLTEIAKMFKQEGRDYVLEIVRGQERKTLMLKLRRLI
jgi:hypothetical protein